MGKWRRGECVACPGPTARIRQRDESLAATLPESRLLASASLVFRVLAPLSVEIVGKGRQHLRGTRQSRNPLGTQITSIHTAYVNVTHYSRVLISTTFLFQKAIAPEDNSYK